MDKIFFKNIKKSYDKKKYIIENFNLTINEGDFVVILGPSGCGKSTLLKLIAGIEKPDMGEIIMNGENILKIEPKDRNIAMVFQNYALYPHMNVYKNIAINLILKKVQKKEVDKRVQEVAKLLYIDDLLDRKPSQLSGGQMQRVALARAMIRNPRVFLMDEPLSNLDSKLRAQTRTEIMKLYKRLKVTTIYVTHDQIEAMTMASSIVLMNDGKIVQKGTPSELYNNPNSIFSANFIGSPQMNLIDSKIIDGKFNVFGKNIEVNKNLISIFNSKIVVGLRAEDIKITHGDKFNIELIENLGSDQLVTLKHIYNKYEFVSKVSCEQKLKVDDRCDICFDKNKIHIFDKETSMRIKY